MSIMKSNIKILFLRSIQLSMKNRDFIVLIMIMSHTFLYIIYYSFLKINQIDIEHFDYVMMITHA